jgi:hypothetical protein
MKTSFLKHWFKGQSGTALVEVLMSVAITGVLGAGTVMSISSIYDQNTLQTIHLSAVMQSENAVVWLSRDARMAQTIDPTGETGFPLSLSWADWEGDSHQVTYAITGSELVRTHLYGGESCQTVIATSIVIGNLTNCQYAGGVLNYKFTTRVSMDQFAATETRTGEVKPRAAM